MIRIYTGTPGSGKSLHAIQRVLRYLQDGKQVIANFPLKYEDLKKKHRHGKFFYVPNENITVDYLYQFNNIYHKEPGENQSLLIIDEASVKFNCRTSTDKDRLSFCSLFAQHRKFGFEIVLIAQNSRQIDRQIRDLIELEVIHRKMNNFSFFSFLPFNLFVAVEKNVAIKQKNDHDFFLYNKYYGNLYDTFYDFTRTTKYQDNQKLINDIENSLLYDSELMENNTSRNQRTRRRKTTAPMCPRGGAPGPPGILGAEDDADEDEDFENSIFKDYEVSKNNDKIHIIDNRDSVVDIRTV